MDENTGTIVYAGIAALIALFVLSQMKIVETTA